MDWFSWLSKTSLDPSSAYDYAITFAQNELEEDDIAHFNHEFLQSMGISVAKHRLEIIKHARKDHKTRSLRPMVWLLIAFKQAKNYVAKNIRPGRVGQDNSSALSVVPQRNRSSRWKAALLKRNRNLIQTSKQAKPMLFANGSNVKVQPAGSGQEILMLTNGSPLESDSSSDHSSEVEEFHFHTEKVNSNIDGEFWSSGFEELRWEKMFQNLKPT